MSLHTLTSKTRGTTLIELMLYLAIATGLVIGVGVTSLSVLLQREKARSIDLVRYADAIAINIVSEDIRAASRIEIPLLPNEASTTLRLRFADPLRDPTVVDIEGGMLYRTVATGSRMQLLPNSVYVSNGMFTHIEATKAEPSIAISGTLGTGGAGVGNAYRATREIKTAATLRAPQP